MDLVVPALTYAPQRIAVQEADSPSRRAARAHQASRETLAERNRLERDLTQQLQARLEQLKGELQQRLLAAPDGLSSFRQAQLQTLLAEVDRLIAQASADLATLADRQYSKAADLGGDHATEPLRAAQLTIAGPGIGGLDRALVTAAFDTTVDLLSPPMQQFATDIKVAVRRVATGGENLAEEQQRLQRQLSGEGFEGAAFRAERILRTEVGRVFNEAAFARLVALAQDFPFLRKGWRASRDNRTRLGHREAGQVYARGQGIPIAELFLLTVYSERSKKGPVRIGQAHLRFPLDPNTTPTGRIAAGATILCRCNAFVDFALEEFAAYTRARVQVALSPEPLPAPVTLPAPKDPVTTRPRVRTPRTRTPRVTRGKARLTVGPAGPAVSSAIATAGQVSLRRLRQTEIRRIERSLAILDRVHGDGALPRIPVHTVRSEYSGAVKAYYAHHGNTGKPLELAFSREILAFTPRLGTWHEVGHFLDHAGFNPGDLSTFSSASDLAFEPWRAAVAKTTPIQSLVDWRANRGRPTGVSTRHLDYLLSAEEVWARAYSQWLAIRSKDKLALFELRNAQRAGSLGPVAVGTPFNTRKYGEEPLAGHWDFPMHWSNEEFAPIAEQIDLLMERAGWRKLK